MLALIRESLSNPEIADRLGISREGVKYHVSEILSKLDVSNRRDAAHWAESQSPRPWLAGALGPLLFWRRLDVSWLTPAIGGSLLLAIVAGLGLLTWGLLATRGEDEELGFAEAEAVHLAAGRRHTCAVSTVGAVACWGDNTSGQLGDGTNEGPRTVPVDVVGLDSDVVAVTAGYSHTCALMSAGTVKCWGSNSAGRLGIDSNILNTYTPVEVPLPSGRVTSISAGYAHTCAVTSGNVVCWGNNSNGELGRGTTENDPEPRRAKALGGIAVAVSAGRFHTCAALASGRAKCWGQNWEGQVGDGDNDYVTKTLVLKPTNVIDENGAVLTGVRMVVAGDYAHSCALTLSGAVLCWGSQVWCELGNGHCGEGIYRSSVAQNAVGLESGVIGLAAGGAQRQGGHSCAIDSSGAAYCWGRGYEGQLGDGRAVSGTCRGTDRPVAVVGLEAPAKEIASGGRHNCAILENGAIVCWGDNEYGQLGSLSATESVVPVNIAGFRGA